MIQPGVEGLSQLKITIGISEGVMLYATSAFDWERLNS